MFSILQIAHHFLWHSASAQQPLIRCSALSSTSWPAQKRHFWFCRCKTTCSPSGLSGSSLDGIFTHSFSSEFFYFSVYFLDAFCWLDVNDIYLLAFFRHASFVIINLPFIIIFIRITTQTYSILIHLSIHNIDLPIQKQQSPSTTTISSHNEISHY